MTKNYVAGLLLAVMFLFAANARADVVLISSSGNSGTFEFGGDISGDSYTSVSTTYTLSDPNAYFTSFTLNAEHIKASFEHSVGNFTPPHPGVDASGIYTGTFNWTGNFSVNGTTYYFGGPYTEDVTGVTYQPESLTAGVPGLLTGSTPPGGVNFFNLDNFYLGPEDLVNINSITIEFVMTGLKFETDLKSDASNVWSMWSGNIEGAFGVTWTADTPAVPEPATLAVLGLGLAGLAVARRRMKK